MDTSRLLAVVSDVEAEYRQGLSQHLKDVIQQYTVARDTPSQDNTQAIEKALLELNEYIDEGVFARYPPSRLSVLDAIGGSTRVGPGLREQLTKILSVPGQTTAGIVTGLTGQQTDLETFRKACVQTKAGLEGLGVEAHEVQEGQFEVGVLIPEALVDQKLGPLAKELEVWNKVLRVYQEVAGEEEREVTVASLSSGSYEAYLPIGIIAAGLVSKTIDKVLEWYLQVLEIRKRREELKALGAPVAETSAIKKHERDILDKGIRELAEQLVKEAQPKILKERRSELETHLTLSIRQIARFVDKGGTVEVDSTVPNEPDEPPSPTDAEGGDQKAEYDGLRNEFARLTSEFEKVAKIVESGSALKRLPSRTEPILQLGDGGVPEEGDAGAKKKG